MGLKLEVGKTYRADDGSKVGPIRQFAFGSFDAADDGPQGKWVWTEGGRGIGNPHLIALWQDAPTGPVRTVTRKEIKNGIYLDGALIVSDAGFGRLQFAICTTDPETFDKAMDMLRDIRDALEEQA